MGNPPRAPVLASAEVGSYYVQYGRGPFGAWFFFFAVFAFGFAAVYWFFYSDPVTAFLLLLLGIILAGLGLFVYLWTPKTRYS